MLYNNKPQNSKDNGSKPKKYKNQKRKIAKMTSYTKATVIRVIKQTNKRTKCCINADVSTCSLRTGAMVNRPIDLLFADRSFSYRVVFLRRAVADVSICTDVLRS